MVMTTDPTRLLFSLHSCVEKAFGDPSGSPVFLQLNPVPASRPRVGRWGVYYGKNYKQFRKDIAEALANIHPSDRLEPLKGPLYVQVEHRVLKPKTSKRSYPKGDIDNYLKATLDALTTHGVWEDDDQVLGVTSTKRFVGSGDADLPPGISIYIWRLPCR